MKITNNQIFIAAGIAALFLYLRKNKNIMGITGTAKTLYSISGTEIKVRPNYSQRTFTLWKNGTKYRTYQFSKEEFNQATYWTGNDWSQFFKTNDYYVVR